MNNRMIWAMAAVVVAGMTARGLADPVHGYTDTPKLPGTDWHVHDGKRPNPPVVEPPPHVSIPPPADATVLFNGTGFSAWAGRDGEVKWKAEEDWMEVTKTGEIRTRESFGSCELYLEWAAPSVVEGRGQERGNSGVYLMDRYEVQVLDSHENLTYADGQAASLYGMTPPLVNACRKPGEWQSYHIFFEAPEFKDGAVVRPARVSVKHNGIVVQERAEFLGTSTWRELPKYAEHPPKAPLRLQEHGDPVRFRNIWIRSWTPVPE